MVTLLLVLEMFIVLNVYLEFRTHQWKYFYYLHIEVDVLQTSSCVQVQQHPSKVQNPPYPSSNPTAQLTFFERTLQMSTHL